MRIVNLEAKQILNSAGNFTVECKLSLSNGKTACASVPQGISYGDNEKKPVHAALAVKQINKQILPKLKKEIGLTQKKLDRILLENDWGSNATLAVSAAYAKCSEFLKTADNSQLPTLLVLVFEGKKHGNQKLKIQEYMVCFNSIKKGREFYQKAKDFLKSRQDSVLVGSEGGFSPANYSDFKILKTLKNLGAEKIALDVAANSKPPGQFFLKKVIKKFPVFIIEDPLPEKKRENWAKFLKFASKINPDVLIAADDLTVTDPKKIKKGAIEKLFNAVIIKPNQQGTISKAVEAANEAKRHNLKIIVSHRGEDTNDDWIADLAVFLKADYIKFGGFSRGERIAKYNRLLELSL